MREIKFRAWDGKEYSYFNLQQIEQDKSYRIYYNGQKEIDTTIIEQYTGLKDKNGKEIFEGDILKKTYRNGFMYLEIIYYKYYLRAMFRQDMESEYVTGGRDFGSGGYYYDLWQIESYDIEIIGNIHENPELLKEI